MKRLGTLLTLHCVATRFDFFLLFLEDAELFGHKRCLHHRKAKKLKDGKSPSLTFGICGFIKCKNVGG